jgi:hypothetical protein
VHPAILECYKDGTLLKALPPNPPRAARDRLSLESDEAAVLGLLHAWSRRERELAQPDDLRRTARSLLKPGRSHPQSSTRGATPWN